MDDRVTHHLSAKDQGLRDRTMHDHLGKLLRDLVERRKFDLIDVVVFTAIVVILHLSTHPWGVLATMN